MTSYDVAIVGGGPAGSSCAWRLRQAGHSVAIIDRKEFPRDKTCAGWVTPTVWRTLKVDPDEYGRERTLQPIRGFRTGIIGGPDLQTDYESTVSYGIRRCEFDDYLLRRCDADLLLGQPLRTMTRHGDHWLLNGTIKAGVLVGAGGHFCPVARELGARRTETSSVVTAQEVEFAADDRQLEECGVKATVPELYFCGDLAGYGWCFRKGRYLNVGLGRVNAGKLSQAVTEFVDDLRRRGTLAGNVPERFHGHAYQLYERVVPRLVDDGVMLVGDAAGMAYAQSGEGIRPAVESGLLAAQTLLELEHLQMPAATELMHYADRITERFGQPRERSATDWLPHALLQATARRLLRNRTFVRRVVIDDWFLHASQPALDLTSL
ncbi:Putative oxidoreductase [Maioricimonas rarisocia]|uniref:Oxidoreductase n=1 Tax=Maioricimonas rarisocia TaxID=2528026 RepID=A0A517Z738_9PLAN|nr:NAD(P)/FAD-dependent oxidoreductase [Maioricimonas rarisocia]QDU38306.1 Putative oxidoreductase [Maioricimonas rarisocia]